MTDLFVAIVRLRMDDPPGQQNPDDTGNTGNTGGDDLMAKKTMTVRLFCTLDNGSEQWGPGDCPTLPEDEALSLIEMGLAERVEVPKKARSAKTPKEPQPPSGGQPESGDSPPDKPEAEGDQEPPAPDEPAERAGDLSAEAETGGENNG